MNLQQYALPSAPPCLPSLPAAPSKTITSYIPSLHTTKSYFTTRATTLASKVTSFFHNWMERKSAVLVTPNSHIRPTYTLPKTYFNTPAGQSIKAILNFLFDRQLLTAPAEVMMTNLSHAIKNESTNTGEAFFHLVTMASTALGPTPEAAETHLALLEKLRRIIWRKMDDIVSVLQANREEQKTNITKASEDIQRINVQLFETGPLSGEEKERLLQNTRTIQLGIYEKGLERHRWHEEKLELKKTCAEAIKALIQLEAEEFHSPSISADTYEILSTQEAYTSLVTHMRASFEPLFIRFIALDKDHTSQEVVTGRVDIDGNNSLFVPRVGTVDYRSRNECLRDIEQFLKKHISAGKRIEATLFRQKKPALLPPPPAPPTTPRIEEVK